MKSLHEKLNESLKKNSCRPDHKGCNENILSAYDLVKKQFDTLFDTVPFQVLFIDENDAIMNTNTESLDFFGLDQKSMKGKDMMYFLHPDSQKIFKKMKAELKDCKKILHRKLEVIGKEDKIGKFLLDLYLIDDISGKMNYLCLLKEDTLVSKKTDILDHEIKIIKKFLEESAMITLVLDRGLYIKYVNKKGLQTIGFTSEETIGKNWLDDFIPKDLKKRLFSEYKKALNGKIKFPQYYINDILDRKRNKKSILWHSSFIKNNQSRIIASLNLGEDISGQQNMKKKIVEKEKFFKLLADRAFDLIFMIRIKPFIGFDYISPSAKKIIGYRPKDFYADPALIYNVIHPEDRHIMKSILNGSPDYMKKVLLRYVHKNGQCLWIEQNLSPLYEEGKVIGIQGIARDITEQKKAEEKIIYYSFYDKLTSLKNRNYFEEELKRIDSPRQLPLSVIIADVNNLKLTNDAFGHKTGDLLLKKVADILKSKCRKEDVIARWGGDEFAILLPKTNEKSAFEIMSRIKKACEKTKLKEITLSLSIGLAVKNEDSQNIEDIIIKAENRMYKEKLSQSKIIPEQIISFLLDSIFKKNIDSKERLSRIKRNAVLLARNMDIADNDLKNLEMLIQLNNIGYAVMNKKIFFKAEKLTEKEWQMIKKHPEIGYRITEASYSLAHIANNVLAHHESWDGTGYPLGLKNEQIPLHCRMFSVLETYDVIVYGRPYKQAMSKEHAMKELKKCSGKQFDPMIVDMFIEVISKSAD